MIRILNCEECGSPIDTVTDRKLCYDCLYDDMISALDEPIQTEMDI